MFNGLIAKSEIRDNILILIPPELNDDNILILVSHGSGGIGNAEWNTANFFLQKGYKVGLLDYFSKWNINKLLWTYRPVQDEYDITFNQILTDIKFPENNIIHIGFSLGGYLGILNNDVFTKNYCFYPGILGYIPEKDYNNKTVIFAEKDNWCPSSNLFKNSIIAKDCYHGFMIPGKNRSIPVAKYNFPKVIQYEEFKKLKANHRYLSNAYGHIEEKIRLQYDENHCIIYLNMILESI